MFKRLAKNVSQKIALPAKHPVNDRVQDKDMEEGKMKRKKRKKDSGYRIQGVDSVTVV
jgi:hypothetical protein